jgi:8-amino-7-oxononanoate synthase
MNSTSSRYVKIIAGLKETGHYRSLPATFNPETLDLSSNDYLGIGSNDKLKKQFRKLMNSRNYRFGAGGSRLLSGNSKECSHLEAIIGYIYQQRSCLVFNSGYHVNMGILPALATKQDLIIADKLVHASLIDGSRLSRATYLRYRHLDYDHLEKLLQENRDKYENVFIVSESVFSMDGDIVDLRRLVDIKHRFGCYLYLDEAHAVGILGQKGLGVAENCQLINEVDFLIGTFGKALASVGAFVVCDNLFKDVLVNSSRSFIYSTALPPVNLAWSAYVFEKMQIMSEQRKKLSEYSKRFALLLDVTSKSHILPYVVGDASRAVSLSERLMEKGFRVLPVRPPTVPDGSSRLRFSLRADLQFEQLEELAEILKKENHT